MIMVCVGIFRTSGIGIGIEKSDRERDSHFQTRGIGIEKFDRDFGIPIFQKKNNLTGFGIKGLPKRKIFKAI